MVQLPSLDTADYDIIQKLGLIILRHIAHFERLTSQMHAPPANLHGVTAGAYWMRWTTSEIIVYHPK